MERFCHIISNSLCQFSFLELTASILTSKHTYKILKKAIRQWRTHLIEYGADLILNLSRDWQSMRGCWLGRLKGPPVTEIHSESWEDSWYYCYWCQHEAYWQKAHFITSIVSWIARPQQLNNSGTQPKRRSEAQCRLQRYTKNGRYSNVLQA